MTNNIKFKRIMAYLLDLFIISFLVLLVSQIKVLNPNVNKYEKTYNEFNEYYMSKFDNTTVDPNDILNDEYAEYMYDLSYYSISYNLIELGVIVLYSTLFQHFFDGQTIGKKIMKIKLVNEDGKKKPGFIKLFLRSLILPIADNVLMYNSIGSAILVGALFIGSKTTFVYSNILISLAISAFCYVDIIMCLARKDGSSLHDKIFKTKVIEC